MTDFIAIDGESYSEEGEHNYALLASSTDEYIYNRKGLSTSRCLEFLLSLPTKPVKVAFGLNYDVNMILRDVPVVDLVKLWKEGQCTYNGYTLEWIPSKMFLVRTGKRRFRCYDVFGFFQSSFVNALDKWELGSPEMIARMKAERSNFHHGMKDEVIRYCLEECHSLVELCGLLDQALNSVSLKVSSWIGAGAVASSLLKAQGVDHHHVLEKQFPGEVQEAILGSYFGGRVEVFQQGHFPHVHNYDLISAYPSVATTLPSLKDGQWLKSQRYISESDFAIWFVSWKCKSNSVLTPFPFRRKGDIHFPSKGSGYYHAAEVKAALSLPDCGITIEHGYIFIPGCDELPFDFIPQVYEERRKLKVKGHAGEKVLKLGLNSVYGKLAQGTGYRGKTPPYQSFFWAGMITAGTRAKVLQLSIPYRDSLVMIATDGMFFNDTTKLVENSQLGGLDYSFLTDVFIAQPGIYQATDSSGKTFGKSRGFFTREINFEDLRTTFLREGPAGKGMYPSVRFYGLGHMILTGNKDIWRTWQKSTRKLSLHPNRKFLDPHLKSGAQSVRHFPPAMPDGMISEPYVPKKAIGQLSEEELTGYVEHIIGSEQPMEDY